MKFRKLRICLLIALAAMIMALMAGCDAEQAADVIDSAQQAVQDINEKITESVAVADTADGAAAGADVQSDITDGEESAEVPAETVSADEAEEPAESDEAEQHPETQENAEQSEPEPTEEPSNDESHAAEKDYTALSAEELVRDNDGLPEITADCAGAASVNAEIEENFAYVRDDDSMVEDSYYRVWKNGDFLSLLIVVLMPGDCAYYTPYNIDLLSGDRLDGGNLLVRLDVDADELTEAELARLGEEFEYTYGSAADHEDLAGFYDEQYQKTVSADNAETERLWLGDGGQLYFVGRVWAMAGAEYYEYPFAVPYYAG